MPTVCAVVDMVSVAVPAPVPVMETGVVAPKVNVGRSCAPLGLLVIAAVMATLPVKPPLGVTVTVAEFPVVAPGAMVTDVAAMVNAGLNTTESLALDAK